MSGKPACAIILTLLLLSLPSLMLNAKPVKSQWAGTVYISANGSVEPFGAPVTTSDNVTYVLTSNIASSRNGIVVERSNIVIDGIGYTIQGQRTGPSDSYGVDLTGRSNVTIKNARITGFTMGIYLEYASNNTISGNQITDTWQGIYLHASNNNRISHNNITANSGTGIYLDVASTANNIHENNITANGGPGMYLFSASNNSISENYIANNNGGISLPFSSGNVISGNMITANSADGIVLTTASNNCIIKNSVTQNNEYGIRLSSSSGNVFYHNNFVENTRQVFSAVSVNVWDDGYPSGGNFWSNYVGIDADGDGLGDTAYVIDENNTDRYPLAASFRTFNIAVWNATSYDVGVMTNSTLSGFLVDVNEKMISFNVSGVEGTTGFCRVALPNSFVRELWQNNYTVLLNGESWVFKNWTDAINTYIYLNYTYSEHKVEIIPEISPVISLPFLMLTTLIATMLLKKQSKIKTP